MAPRGLIRPIGTAQASGHGTTCCPGVHAWLAIGVHLYRCMHAWPLPCEVGNSDTHSPISKTKKLRPREVSDWSHPKLSFLDSKLSHLAVLPAATQTGS